MSSTPRRGLANGLPRMLVVGIACLAAFQILYVVLGNLLLSSSWFVERVNFRPDRVLIEWHTMRTWFPGHFSGTGLTLRTQSARVQSLTEVDRFSGWLSPLALVSRTVAVSFGSAENLTTRVCSVRMLRKAQAEELEFFPLIPGLEPLMPDTPEELGPFRAGWTVKLADIDLAGRQHLMIGNYEVLAYGVGTGSMAYQVRSDLTIHPSRYHVEGILVLLNGETVLHDGEASGTLSSQPFNPYQVHGIDRLGFVSLNADLAGELSSLEMLNFYLGVHEREDWPGLAAAGQVSGTLVLEDGHLSEATDLTVDAELISFSTRILELQSSGRIRINPISRADAPWSLLRFELDHLKLDHREFKQTLAETTSLEFVVDSSDIAIGTPLRDIAVTARVAKGQVPDLTVLNHFIPPRIPLSITKGSGELSGTVLWDSGQMDGKLVVGAKDVIFDLKDRAVTASFEMDLALAADTDSRIISIGGTTLGIEDARVDEADAAIQPWSAGISIDTGTIQFPEVAGEANSPEGRIAGLVDFTDGELTLAGTISDIDFLDYLLTAKDQLAFQGAGAFMADLIMERGTISAGSTASYESDNLAAHFLDFEARGRGQLVAEFASREARRLLNVTATLDQVALVRDGEQAAFVQAPQVVFHIEGRAPDITEPLEGIDISLDIVGAEVPDITVYNSYLPQSGVLRLVSGRGGIDTRLRVTNDQASGSIKLVAPAITAVLNNNQFTVDIEMEIVLSGGDLDTRVFSLDNSFLRVGNVVYPDGRLLNNWWTLFSFSNGDLHWTTPITLNAETRLEMTSSGPLVELLAGTYGQPRWVSTMLSVNNVVGSSKLIIAPGSVVLNDLDLSGEDLRISAKLRINEDGPIGIVYNRLGILRATVAFVGEQREWFILSARERYERHPGF